LLDRPGRERLPSWESAKADFGPLLPRIHSPFPDRRKTVAWAPIDLSGLAPELGLRLNRWNR